MPEGGCFRIGFISSELLPILILSIEQKLLAPCRDVCQADLDYLVSWVRCGA